MAKKKKIDKDKLIELVVSDIKNDIEAGDVTAVEELLKFCPTENLMAYLPEDVSRKLDVPAEPNHLPITAIQVFPLKETIGKTQGFARVVIADQLQLTGLRIIDGVSGLFVAYPNDPSYKGDDYKCIFYPLTRELREAIEEAVLIKFREAKAAMK